MKNLPRAFVSVALVLALVVAVPFSLKSVRAGEVVQTVYVSSVNGSDTADGKTPTTPWKTLNKVNKAITTGLIGAGTTVYFKRGETFKGILYAQASGTTDLPVKYTDYGTGDKPVLDASGIKGAVDIRSGAGNIIFENLTMTGGTNQTVNLTASPHHITLRGVDVIGSATPAGITISGGSIDSITIESSSIRGVTNGVVISSLANLSNFSINGLNTSNIVDKAVSISGSAATLTSLRITNSIFTGGQYGMEIALTTGSLNGFTFSGNTATGATRRALRISKSGAGTLNDVSIVSNQIMNNAGGLEIAGGASSVNRLRITENTITDNVGVETYGALISSANGKYADVSLTNNTVTGNTSGVNFSFLLGSTLNGLTISQLNASNSKTGFGLATMGQEPSWLTNAEITDSTLNGNAKEGLQIQFGNNIAVRRIQALQNGYSGVTLRQGISAVTVEDSLLNQNGKAGIYSGLVIGNDSTSQVANTTLRNVSLNQNSENGLSIEGAGNGVRVENSTASNNSNDGFNVHGTVTNVVFTGCTANENGLGATDTTAGDGYTFHDKSSGIVEKSRAYNNRKSAVTNIQLTSTIIRNNIFSHDTAGSAAMIGFFSDGGNHQVYNNTLYSAGNVGKGISVTDVNTVTIKNNIVVGFAIGIERNATKPIITEDYNLVYSPTGLTTWRNLTAGANSLSADPLFNNPSAQDFTLADASPAIDAAQDMGISEDSLGNPRHDRASQPDYGSGTVKYGDLGALENLTDSSLSIMSVACPSQSIWCAANTIDVAVTGAAAGSTFKYLISSQAKLSAADLALTGIADADGKITVTPGLGVDSYTYVHILVTPPAGETPTVLTLPLRIDRAPYRAFN